jgi:hypothetical protein
LIIVPKVVKGSQCIPTSLSASSRPCIYAFPWFRLLRQHMGN